MNNLCKFKADYFSKFFLSNALSIGIRNSSDIAGKLPENDEKFVEYKVNPNYLNRNPRNLEWSGHAHKRLGWHLQYPPKDFYYRCILEIKIRKICASVEHFSGKVLIEVKSSDINIMRHLANLKDASATINVARVLAEKCHQYGITQMRFMEDITKKQKSSKAALFKKTLLESGLQFEEPEYISGEVTKPGLDYENKNFYSEQRKIPFPPHVNRIKRRILNEAENDLKEKKKIE